MPQREDRPSGVYQGKREWMPFNPPVGRVFNHKVDFLYDICENPKAWFPQMVSESPSVSTEGWTNHEKTLHPLLKMKGKIESIVLVDDERASFVSDNPEPAPGCERLIRYCKVARYDEEYRDCGLLNSMGGIGAHSDEDYRLIKQFVNKPWEMSRRKTHPVVPEATPAGDSVRDMLDLWRTQNKDDDIFHIPSQRAALAARGLPKPPKHKTLERLRAGTGTSVDELNETPIPMQSQCSIHEERLERREESKKHLEADKLRTLTI